MSDVICDGVPKSTTMTPTGNLRWVPKSSMQAADLVLQQEWCVLSYMGGAVVEIEFEWRDVPVVRNPDKDSPNV
jgi:hypothetical protein